ncbi:uncharacterized protein LOC142575560 isoform X5 [Dermacentor variabilis]|uniref:uncharacterized protein LOC142575560 isoform X5 n=1 Tax=Dermacentor variabilis TaxID=34621 RepID=UPI003F5C047A
MDESSSSEGLLANEVHSDRSCLALARGTSRRGSGHPVPDVPSGRSRRVKKIRCNAADATSKREPTAATNHSCVGRSSSWTSVSALPTGRYFERSQDVHGSQARRGTVGDDKRHGGGPSTDKNIYSCRPCCSNHMDRSARMAVKNLLKCWQLESWLRPLYMFFVFRVSLDISEKL